MNNNYQKVNQQSKLKKVQLLQELQAGKITLAEFKKSFQPKDQLCRVELCGRNKNEPYYLYYLNRLPVEKEEFEAVASKYLPTDIITFR